MKIVKKIQLKIVIFTTMKYCSILHGRIFVMKCLSDRVDAQAYLLLGSATCTIFLVLSLLIAVLYEPHREKSVSWVSDQVRHKPGCTDTEEG